MDFFFADDSRQRTPTRQGMNALVGVGGIYVPSQNVKPLERALNALCVTAGFPPGEEFKWSPGREDWMRDGLTARLRSEFYSGVLRLCSENRVRIVVVASDTSSAHPRACTSHEHFVVQMLIERIERLAAAEGSDAVIVFDRPGGAQDQDDSFLAQCLETIQDGTAYVRPNRIALNALSTGSHFIRLLQAADVVAGCVLANLSGETRYSPAVLTSIKPMIASSNGSVGGFGIKICPDFWYVNLYRWLFDDTHYWRGNVGHPLPLGKRPYSRNGAERRHA
jgi:hypothetical protein